VFAEPDLAQLIISESEALGGLWDGDVVVVTSKIVSKAEGRAVAAVAPFPFARNNRKGEKMKYGFVMPL